MTTAQPDGYTLVAMVPSGESLFVRDRSGQIWFMQSVGKISVNPASEADIAKAIIQHDWVSYDQLFDTWEDLEQYRQATAMEVTEKYRATQVRLYDSLDVMIALDDLVDAEETGDSRRAIEILMKILADCPLLASNRDLNGKVLARLRELQSFLLTPPLRTPPAELRNAMDRMHLPTAA